MIPVDNAAGEIVRLAESKLAPLEFIRAEVGKLDLDVVQEIAVAYLFMKLKQADRRKVLNEEKLASVPDPQSSWSPSRNVGAGTAAPNEGTEEFERWYANDVNRGYWDTVGRADRARQEAEWEATIAQNREVLTARKAKEEAESDERKRELWASMERATSDLKHHWRMEWNRELLDSKFALRDGTRIAWGDATREQHIERMDIHKRNAIAGMEGFGRHEQAIEELDRTGAATLREAVGVAA